MNKILIDNNIINEYKDDYMEIKKNNIIFKKDNDYNIIYTNCQNINIVFTIKENVNVNLFELSIDNDVKVNNIYNLENNSKLVISKFYNNKRAGEKIIFNLNGFKSTIEYYFSNVCLNNEKYKIIVNHNDKETISNIENKLITINENSYLDMDLDSNVASDRNDCILNQNTRILTNNNSNVTVKPNMYIDCDDIIAKHSSTIGTFDENALFYLMSRGISYKDAYRLLIKGFIFSNLKIDKSNREQVMNIINNYWR